MCVVNGSSPGTRPIEFVGYSVAFGGYQKTAASEVEGHFNSLAIRSR
jgi:hypothetical protein